MCLIINILDDINQSTFVPGRLIHGNAFLAQELVHGYGRKQISPRCIIQMDLWKAYNTVEWEALEGILREVGFQDLFGN